MKPISKQTNEGRPSPETTRTMNTMPSNAQPGDEDESKPNEEEERYDHSRGELLGNEPNLPAPIFWDFEINILGMKDDTLVHFCDKCELPIKIYGRMIPCKHVFCYGCAILPKNGTVTLCLGCNNPVQRVEQHTQGSLFMCTTVQGCKRTYLSQRDLQAHINHRHSRTVTYVTPALNKDVPPNIGPPPAEIPDSFTMPLDNHQASHIPPEQHIGMSPPPLQHVPGNPNLLLEGPGTPTAELAMPVPPPSPHWVGQESFPFSAGKPSDLTAVPIWNNANSGIEDLPPPVPVFPPQYTDPQDQMVVSYPYEIGPPWLYYGLQPQPLPGPPPSLPATHLMRQPSQAAGTSLVYSQAPAPPVTASVLPLPGNIVVQMLPNVNQVPVRLLPPSQYGGLPVNVPGPYNNYPDFCLQFTENQGTFYPPFIPPGGMQPGMWPEPRELPPPYPPVPEMQGPPQGPQDADQERQNQHYQ